MTSKEQQIKNFNQFVERTIREDGTCEISMRLGFFHVGPKMFRIAIFEADAIEADDSIDGFVGWWEDDFAQRTYADTPYEVYCDMP